MLVFKALYKKMMDDLKDAGMWIDWAEQLAPEYPEIADYLIESAKERLEESFSKTYEHFEKMCEEHRGKDEICMHKIVYDQIMDWRQSMLTRIDHLEKSK